jgi:sulfide:quinone oxidoreductase
MRRHECLRGQPGWAMVCAFTGKGGQGEVGAARRLNAEIWVGATPSADFIYQTALWGVKSIINNQGDDEEIRILTSEQCAQTAQRLGLGYAHSIVEDRFHVTNEEVERFIRNFEALPKPVFVYCRAGYRASLVWGMAQVGKMDIDDIVEEIFDVGYDMTLVGRPQMEARLEWLEKQGRA